MTLAGLRGGVAFVLSLSWITHCQNNVIFATSNEILFTMLVYGTIMKPLLKMFKIPLEKVQPYKFDC